MAAIGDDAIRRAAKTSPLQAKYGRHRSTGIRLREDLQAKKAQEAQAGPPAEAGSKSAPAPAKKPGWFKRFVNSRGFQIFLKSARR